MPPIITASFDVSWLPVFVIAMQLNLVVTLTRTAGQGAHQNISTIKQSTFFEHIESVGASSLIYVML